MLNETQNFIEKITLVKAKLRYEYIFIRLIVIISRVSIKFIGIIKKYISILRLIRLA
jgi:hypothetical protein